MSDKPRERFLDPWSHVTIIEEPGGGKRHTTVQCDHCELIFTAASATRIEGHLVGDTKAGVKACSTIAKVQPALFSALTENFEKKIAARLEKKRGLNTEDIAGPSKPNIEKQSKTKKHKTEGSNPYPPANAARAATADLADGAFPHPIDITAPQTAQCIDPRTNLRDYGGRIRFFGQAATIKCFENNPLVRKALEEDGKGRVLIVDGGASYRCALLGDNLAEMGYKNGWQGVIVNGCIRDSEDIGKMPLGVKALNTHPIKSSKRDVGLRDVPVSFGGVTISPGDWIYADKDGVLISAEPLSVK